MQHPPRLEQGTLGNAQVWEAMCCSVLFLGNQQETLHMLEQSWQHVKLQMPGDEPRDLSQSRSQIFEELLPDLRGAQQRAGVCGGDAFPH